MISERSFYENKFDSKWKNVFEKLQLLEPMSLVNIQHMLCEWRKICMQAAPKLSFFSSAKYDNVGWNTDKLEKDDWWENDQYVLEFLRRVKTIRSHIGSDDHRYRKMFANMKKLLQERQDKVTAVS